MVLMILLAIFLIIIFILTYKAINKSKEQRKKSLKENKSFDNELVNDVLKVIHKTDFSEDLSSMVSYILFKSSCSFKVLASLNSTDKDKNKKYQDIMDNSKVIDNALRSIYASYVYKNMEEAKSIESEAVGYHNTFGKEDPNSVELHAKETSSDASESPEVIDKDVEELVSTGTVEDIE